MRTVFVICMLVSSCSHSPTPQTTAFGDPNKIVNWFAKRCDYVHTSTSITDGSLPAAVAESRVYTCHLDVGAVIDARFEIQGDPLRTCAVRIGPAELSGPVDPSFIADWFDDPALAARAKAAVSGLPTQGTYDQIAMIDGIRIAVLQRLGLGSRFYLVVDGCERYPERKDVVSRID